MKRLWLAFLLVFLLLPGVASAQVQTEKTVIKQVYYDPEVKSYCIETDEDEEGAFWYLCMFYMDKENKALTKALQQALLNKKIEVTYEDYESEDSEDWEMIEFVVLN
ncbi:MULTISPECIES: hypothetical protein [Aneurinibacillus]|uniref:Uncharacterized protein n=1 Tax=Aneurinibacillus thermoaerophilus TaxID=143495 RepID=A0A1G8FJD1_ANETH|nr:MULTISPECIES: hypothetical protein [Aneurinibacillus]AMA72249.1 hypothetical protein ACH33_04850 [Aneurinibacillus sp. XH2]MED0677547.1 hypothetical protein [Aneurinibacillus thermoaerophilus]MED0681017.1 hypothetical protein [Aneurinibacillus thermoaerophilus]MED0738960.1 hypothetical protein [Aneurinibacillus thermoaerophilus]MED0758927.1 hypothetical protein [Aneurinibacillus thermoaerophilus]